MKILKQVILKQDLDLITVIFFIYKSQSIKNTKKQLQKYFAKLPLKPQKYLHLSSIIKSEISMKSNIGIESVNNLAFSSVNRFTSSIKSTLEKGNSLIRSELYHSKSPNKNTPKILKHHPETQPTEEQINALQLFERVKQYAKSNQKVKRNIINILNFAELKWRQFCGLPNKSAHQYSEYLQKFKKIDFKLNANLNYLTEQDNIQELNTIKVQFKRIIEYLNQRARKYIDKNKQIINLIKKKDKEEFQEECQEEAIKQEMLELLDRLKGQAINMGSDLKKDNVVISQIHQKQDRQLNTLTSKSKGLQDMMNSQKMGFFKLISYAGIGIVVWIFTLLFILIF